jgi:hypothetical protein
MLQRLASNSSVQMNLLASASKLGNVEKPGINYFGAHRDLSSNFRLMT